MAAISVTADFQHFKDFIAYPFLLGRVVDGVQPRVGNIKHVFGATADRGDFRAVQMDVLLHEGLADFG